MEALKDTATRISRRTLFARVGRCALRFLVIGCLLVGLDPIATSCRPSFAQQFQLDLPSVDPQRQILFTAARANRWRQGQYDVWHLQGQCEIKQGELSAHSHEAILWIDIGDPYTRSPDKIIAYLEGEVGVEFGLSDPNDLGLGRQRIEGQRWLGRFETERGIDVEVPTIDGEPSVMPEAFVRGADARRRELAGLIAVDEPEGEVVQTQFQTPLPPGVLPPPGVVRQPNTRVTFGRRTGVKPNIRNFRSPGGTQQIWVGGPGVTVTVESDEFADLPQSAGVVRRVTISADQMVAWTDEINLANPTGIAGPDRRWEIYLEGNIVYSDGQRVVYADQMYYDVNARRGTILNAEMLTPVPEYQGLLRLKAEILQQIDETHFQAFGSAMTSSRMGYPRYWVQPNQLEVEHNQIPLIDPLTGQPQVDPATGQQAFGHEYLARAKNNVVYLGGFPVFYWPTLTTDLANPTFYLTGLELSNDEVFGSQVRAELDMYQLLGLRNPPPGTDWGASLDYLSYRGFGLGTNFDFEGTEFLGIQGGFDGFVDAWGINDSGLDNLGRNRRALVPEANPRGRVLYQLRHNFVNGWQVKSELGYISDRNFLEQYYEKEWDEHKDEISGTEIKRIFGSLSIGGNFDTRVNDFFTQTEWLPRADAYLLGQSLLGDRLTWFSHSDVGYGKMEVTTKPEDPADAAGWELRPWEVNAEGIRAQTRNEIDLPLQVGGAKVVPYVSGDVTYWNQNINRQEVTRLTGQAGVRASIPFWRVDPTVQSSLLNLTGMAHKVSFDADLFWADSDQDVFNFPLYDHLDDDSQEDFRRRYPSQIFGGTIPPQFDERSYTLRSGIQRWTSSPTAEIMDDLALAKLGMRNRWQTKRGLPGQQRIIDWISFDVEGIFYPKPDRDNFGEYVGMVDYDFRWHVGDRLTLMSDGYYDFFADGMRTTSLSGLITRPEYGDLYLGIRNIEGPITSSILSGAVSYRMSEKWIARAGASYDFGPTGDIGQTFSFTRIGESFLLRLGFNVDVSKGSAGIVFSVEPRFLPNSSLGQLGGVNLPPPGVRGLE